MNTTQLVQRVLEGDEQALSELYYDSYRQAYFVALLMTGSEEDAYDVMQEAYFKAFANLELLTDKASFDSWFHKIVVLRIRDYLMRKRHTVLCFDDADAAHLEPYEGKRFEPLPHTDYSAGARVAAQMFHTLTAEQKLTLAASVLTEMTVCELADALEVSETAVSSVLNDSKLALQVQAELRDEQEESLPFSAEEAVSFVTFMLCTEAGKSAVHEMAPKVKGVVSGSADQKTSAGGAKAAKPPLFKSRGQKLAVIAAGVTALLALSLCFTAFVLPKITGKHNVVSALFFQADSGEDVSGITPETLLRDFEKAFKENDEDAMATLFVPENRTAQKARGFGISIIKEIVDKASGGTAEYTFSNSEVAYNGDTASAQMTITLTMGLAAEKSFPYDVTFVRYKGRWYIKSFG